MDKYRISSAALQGRDALKGAPGKATGDTKMPDQGKKMDKAEGKVQDTAAGVKDVAREALDE